MPRANAYPVDASKTVCVDVDGVLSHSTPWQGVENFGLPIPWGPQFTAALKNLGFEVVIYSCRTTEEIGRPMSASLLRNILRDWLDIHGFVYDHIFIGQGKPPAIAYVDDRGVSCCPEKHGVEAFQRAIKQVVALAAL